MTELGLGVPLADPLGERIAVEKLARLVTNGDEFAQNAQALTATTPSIQ
jgi:hypothetical protein